MRYEIQAYVIMQYYGEMHTIIILDKLVCELIYIKPIIALASPTFEKKF